MATDATTKGFVLIPEDVKVISRKMIIGLESCGYKVALAEDGEQCLDMARKLRPNLVILDIMMPKIHGIEVLKQLRADPSTQGIGVIVCTAKSFETELNHVATLGAYDFLIKPFNLPALTEMVDGFFESRPGTDIVERRQQSHHADVWQVFRPTLQPQSTRLTLWGARGSVPTPGANFLRHGGQTSCMAVTTENAVCIFDA